MHAGREQGCHLSPRGVAPGLAGTRDRAGAQLCSHRGRVRRGADGGRQHSRSHAHALHRYLRPGAEPELRFCQPDSPCFAGVFLLVAVPSLRTQPFPELGWPVNVLEVKLHKAFPAGKLRRFSLDAEFAAPAGVTVIFGPSGSGKTTILQCLAGLLRPDRGSIKAGDETLFDSARKVDLSPQQRRVGYVFQDLALFPHMSAAENIAFGVRGNGSRRATLVRDALERFRLEHVAAHRPGEISGGERQRVALARALVTGPRLLLLDEPFSALDDALKLEIIADLKQWLSGQSVPALFVTHDRSEAEALGERMLLLNEGKIVGERQMGNGFFL